MRDGSKKPLASEGFAAAASGNSDFAVHDMQSEWERHFEGSLYAAFRDDKSGPGVRNSDLLQMAEYLAILLDAGVDDWKTAFLNEMSEGDRSGIANIFNSMYLSAPQGAPSAFAQQAAEQQPYLQRSLEMQVFDRYILPIMRRDFAPMALHAALPINDKILAAAQAHAEAVSCRNFAALLAERQAQKPKVIHHVYQSFLDLRRGLPYGDWTPHAGLLH